FGKKPPSRKFKKWQGIFAVMVSSLSAWIKGSKPLVTKETIQLASDMTIFDSSKIQNLLNFKFKKLEDTVRWTTRELKKNNL
ncbi:MAG: hypothetical protein AAF519_02055, partial [Bacteroidota bacterium]